jgi:hypothetical protein
MADKKKKVSRFKTFAKEPEIRTVDFREKDLPELRTVDFREKKNIMEQIHGETEEFPLQMWNTPWHEHKNSLEDDDHAFVIDVDKEVLEVYTGFNNDKEHFTERFEFLRGNLKERDGYGLVKLYETYDLNALPEQITPEPNEDDEDDDDE